MKLPRVLRRIRRRVLMWWHVRQLDRIVEDIERCRVKIAEDRLRAAYEENRLDA